MARSRRITFVFAALFVGCTTTTPPIVPAELIISIDVEALPYRQDGDHIQRLIFGRFDGHEVGIEEMMRIADKYGAKLSFFLDVCESELYGDSAIKEVAQSILVRGHDLQIHCHPGVLSEAFWVARGLQRPTVDEDQYSEQQALELMRFATEASVRFGNADPVAYRSGGLFYGESILTAMAHFNLQASFNYAWRFPGQRGSQEDVPVFRWSDGLLEFPVGIYVNDDGGQETLDMINLVNDEAVNRLYDIVQYVAGKQRPKAVVTMIGHSWSLLDLDPKTNYFYYRSDLRQRAFDRFLRDLPKQIRVISAREALSRIRTAEIPVARVRDVAVSQNLPPATGATLTPSLPSPQEVGTSVVFVADATGSSDYDYQFWIRAPGGTSFSIVQDYGMGSSWTLPPTLPAGEQRVQVHVRTGHAGGFGAMASANYTLLPATQSRLR